MFRNIFFGFTGTGSAEHVKNIISEEKEVASGLREFRLKRELREVLSARNEQYSQIAVRRGSLPWPRAM